MLRLTQSLPDPLLHDDGTAIADADAWRRRRRPELLRLFESEMYGRPPLREAPALQATPLATDEVALDGRALRREVLLRPANPAEAPALHLLIYLPRHAAAGPCPAFVGLNFYGNHTVTTDPGVALSPAWIPDSPGVVDNRATERSRGIHASRWPVEEIVAQGFAMATLYCGDACLDRPDGLAGGVSAWLRALSGQGPAAAADDHRWGAVGVWAWALSRALDHLVTDPRIDARRIGVHGHSRLGKAALWAAAQDERFAFAISNNSGCCGASLSKHVAGETLAAINRSFPHWFCPRLRYYSAREQLLPFDQHELLALIAPRPLYVASATEDKWADPQGEFMAVKAASPVYGLFNIEGIDAARRPPPNRPVGRHVRYHIRRGAHDITAFDWRCYLDAARWWFGMEPRTAT